MGIAVGTISVLTYSTEKNVSFHSMQHDEEDELLVCGTGLHSSRPEQGPGICGKEVQFLENTPALLRPFPLPQPVLNSKPVAALCQRFVSRVCKGLSKRDYHVLGTAGALEDSAGLWKAGQQLFFHLWF